MGTTTMNKTNSKQLTDDVSKLKDDLTTVREDISEISSRLIEEARDRATYAGERVKDGVEDSIRKTRKTVVSRPVTSLAIAAGLGACCAWFFARKPEHGDG